MTLYLTESDVRELVGMPLALEAVESAMRSHASGEAVDVPRQRTRIPGAMMHLLQGASPADGVIGYKVYTTTREGARFWLHLYDVASGRALAVIEADYLGMMRTGAAGGLAARLLSRADARVAAVIGAGWQARGQIEALCRVRALDEVRVFARNPDRLRAFCREMGERMPCPVLPAGSAREAVTGAGIVVTVTGSSEPVIEAAWLGFGVHINAAGSNSLARRELGEDVFRRAGLICVDSRDVALRESGDLLPMLEKGRVSERKLCELGEVLAGCRPGRVSQEEITVFESQGMAVQDLALGARVLALARERGLGKELPF